MLDLKNIVKIFTQFGRKWWQIYFDVEFQSYPHPFHLNFILGNIGFGVYIDEQAECAYRSTGKSGDLSGARYFVVDSYSQMDHTDESSTENQGLRGLRLKEACYETQVATWIRYWAFHNRPAVDKLYRRAENQNLYYRRD